MLLAMIAALPLATTCSVGGVTGVCKDVSLCSDNTYAGLCPGASNIKCCVDYYGTCAYGTCISEGSCTGTTYSGLCPGSSNIKCCKPTVDYGTCTANGIAGKCQETSSCTGTTTSGLCPGPSDITCCTIPPPPPPSPSTSTCTANGVQGQCIPSCACTGTTHSGLCAGAADIKCCTGATTGGPACTTSINKFTGVCKNVNGCTGGSFRGLCSGSASMQCCVAEAAIADVGGLNLAQFQEVFTAVCAVRAAALLPHFNAAMVTVLKGATTSQACYRKAAFVAQVGHESAGLLYFEELASGEAYEGRTDLGNTEPGDGKRYKGRGPIQLTGRANYRAAGIRLELPLEDEPEMVVMPAVAFKTTVDYWISRSLNKYAETGTYDDFVTLTKRINGGTNGLTDRVNRWNTAKSLFGC